MDVDVRMMEIREIREEEERLFLYRYPKGFNKKDKSLIEKFGDRLKAIREKRAIEAADLLTKDISQVLSTTVDYLQNHNWTLEDFAKSVGWSTTTAWKYENKSFNSIPVDKLKLICDYYSVTPHYILGYVDKEDKVLYLNEDDDIVIKDGKVCTLSYELISMPLNSEDAILRYRNLYAKDIFLFDIINRIMESPKNKRDIYAKMMHQMLKL